MTLEILINSKITLCRVLMDTGADISLGDINFLAKLKLQVTETESKGLRGIGRKEETNEFVVTPFKINEFICPIRLFLVELPLFEIVKVDVLFGRDILGPQRLLGWSIPYDGESTISVNEVKLREGLKSYCNEDVVAKKPLASLQPSEAKPLEDEDLVEE